MKISAQDSPQKHLCSLKIYRSRLAHDHVCTLERERNRGGAECEQDSFDEDEVKRWQYGGIVLVLFSSLNPAISPLVRPCNPSPPSTIPHGFLEGISVFWPSLPFLEYKGCHDENSKPDPIFLWNNLLARNLISSRIRPTVLPDVPGKQN